MRKGLGAPPRDTAPMAARAAPAMTPSTFARRLRDEGAPPVVVAAGTEAWFRDQVARLVVRRVLPQGDPGGAYERLDGQRPEDHAAIEGALDGLRATSLFATERVLRIDEPDLALQPGRGKPLWSTQLAKRVMADPPRGAVLLLVTRRGVKGKGSIGAAAVARAGAWLVDCRALYDAPAPWERGRRPHDHELARHLVKRMRRAHGRSLGLEEAHFLAQRVGNKLAALEDALTALALGVKAEQAIDAAAIDAALGDTREDPLWPIGDAVLDGKTAQAAARVSRAFARGFTDARGRPVLQADGIFMLLHASLRQALGRAWSASEALARGTPADEVARQLKVPRFVADALLRRARRNPDAFARAHTSLFDAAFGVRSGRVPPRVAGERMVMAMATALQRQDTGRSG